MAKCTEYGWLTALTEGGWSQGHRAAPRRPFSLQNSCWPDTVPGWGLQRKATSHHLPSASGPWPAGLTPPWTQTRQEGEEIETWQCIFKSEWSKFAQKKNIVSSKNSIGRVIITSRQLPIHSDTRMSTCSGSSMSSARPCNTVTTSSHPFCFTSCLVYSAMELASTAYTYNTTDYFSHCVRYIL